MVAMDRGTLIVLLGMIGIPVGLLAAVGVMGWRYRRAIARSMARSATTTSSAPLQIGARETSSSARITLRHVDSTQVRLGSTSAETALADARHTSGHARRGYLVAGLVYAVVAIFALVSAAHNMPFDARISIGCLALAPQLIIVTSFLGLRPGQSASIGAGYVLLAAFPALVLVGQSRSAVLVPLTELFALYPSAGLMFLLTRRLQPFLIVLVAISIYVAVGAGVVGMLGVSVDATEVRFWLIAIGIVNFVLGVGIIAWLLNRRSIVRPFAVLATLAVSDVATRLLLGRSTILEAVPVGVLLNALQVFAVWLIFKLFVMLQERRLIANELLHAHLCWSLLTFYFVMLSGTAIFDDGAWLPWALVLALGLHVVTLHRGFRRVRVNRVGKRGKRLLLLRAFGGADRLEGLLGVLDDTWRRIGEIDLITGSDLAVRTLRPRMLEAFLLRRVDDHFLRTNEDVDRRLEHVRSELEGDGRYPVNSVNCYETAWQRAVGRLAPNSDVVLMDMRGFTRENKGCQFELTFVVQRVVLRRIVLLVDRSTNLEALTQAAHAAWAELPFDSPNALDREPILTVLSFDGCTKPGTNALFELLLNAAFASDALKTGGNA